MPSPPDSVGILTAMTAIWQWVVATSGLATDHVLWSYNLQQRPTAPYILLTWQQVRGVGHDWTTSEDNPLTIADVATGVSGSNITIPAHGLSNGDGPVNVATTGTLPSPLVADTNYWVIYVDANTIKLAASFVNTGGQMPLGTGNPVTPITLTTTGTGTLSVVSTEDTVHAGQEVLRRAQGFREVTISLECFAQEGKGVDAVRILSNVLAGAQLYIYPLDLAGFGLSDLGQGFSQDGVKLLEGQRRGSILEPRSIAQIVGYMASDFVGYDTIIEQVEVVVDVDDVTGDQVASIPLTIDVGEG